MTFLNGNLGHQRALRARLVSDEVSAIELISDGNLDESCKCPVLFDAGRLCTLGSTLFRGRVRIYAPMRVAAQRGWGRDLNLQNKISVAEIWGFQMARIWMMDSRS